MIRQDDRDADGRFRVPFFVPTQFDHVSFSNLPTSLNLRAALRKIGVRHLRDLNGISTHDFIRVGPEGHALAREVLQLVEQIRTGILETQPRNQATGQLNSRRRKGVEVQELCFEGEPRTSD